MNIRRATSITFCVVVVLALASTILSSANALNQYSTGINASVGSLADGAALYNSKCGSCHGGSGSGTAGWRSKGQPDLSSSEWQQARSDEQISSSIRNGKGKFMPAFAKKLTGEEISALVRQVRNFRR